MRNDYGVKLDRNGYAPSILQGDSQCCWLCGRSDQKLDRHEPFGGPFRNKSKSLGMWVLLCHERCHFGRVHKYQQDSVELKKSMQAAAMVKYKWDEEEFIQEFGRNWL